MSEAAAASKGGDWRESVSQTYRSGEIRSIADVLATCEPGATSASKKMLAMKFEDSIFKAASSLDDYHKTIAKKLKRVQKHYAKTQTAAGGVAEEDKDLIREKELLFQKQIRDEYGEKLIYIAKHADRAVHVTRVTAGEQKAKVLKDHCDTLKKRALQLGVPLEGVPPLPRLHHEMKALKQLKAQLDGSVDNVRSHVVKIADVDVFLLEQLEHANKKLLKSENSNLFRKALQEATDSDNTTQFTVQQMKLLTEIMNIPTPIPRRNQAADQVRAALSRIEKIRASTQAIMTYCGLTAEEKTSFPGSLEKSCTILKESLTALEKEHSSLFEDVEDKDEDGNPKIKLEDAWNKHLQYLDDSVPAAVDDVDITGVEPSSKRQKTDQDSNTGPPRVERNKMVISTRVLLTPGRKTFSTLIPALKRKKAILMKNGTVSSIRMEFGTAFEMTIYFKPLLVTIRAMKKGTATTTTSSSMGMAALSGGIQWPSLYQGLNTEDATNDTKSNQVSVLGVTGTISTLAPIIAKQLDYASSQATHVLRKCFAETVNGQGGSSKAKSEFEIEILEAGALIKFLKIVRSTYHDGRWVDVED